MDPFDTTELDELSDDLAQDRTLDLPVLGKDTLDIDSADDMDFDSFQDINSIPDAFEDPQANTINLKSAVSDAFTKNSNDVSKAIRLAGVTELPREVVESNVAEAEQLEKLRKVNFEDLQKNYPGISKLFADADNAAVFQDHIEDLKAVEDAIKGKEPPSFNTGRKLVERSSDLVGGFIGFADKTSNFIEESLGDFGLGEITYRKPETFMENFTFQNFGYRSAREANALKEAGTYPKRLSETASKELNDFSIGYVPTHTWEKTKEAFSEGGVFSGSAWGEVMSYAFENGVGSLPDMAGAVLALPAYIASRTNEVGETRAKNDGRTETEMTDLLKAAPFVIGSAILEKIGGEGMIGAGKKAAEEIGKEALQFSFSRIAKNGLKAGNKEFWTEAAQEGILEYLGEKWGTRAKMSYAEAFDRGLGGAVAGGITGGQIGGAVATYNEYKNTERTADRVEAKVLGKQIKDQSEQDRIDNIVELMQPLKEMNPELAQSAVLKFQEEHGLEEERIYINPMRLQEAITEGEYDLSEAKINEVNELTNDAIQTGTDVELTLTQYFEFAEDQEVRNNIRLSEDGMSLNEIKNAPEDQRAMTERMLAEADKNVVEKTEADRIWTEVTKQLVDTGTMNSRTAKVQASLIPAYVTTKAVRTGKTVEEVYADLGVTIEGQEQDRSRTGSGQEASVTLEQAKEQGYEGGNQGEAQEWLSAKAKGLDMSQEGRMQRAQEMGFDTDTVYYHGTRQDIKAFDTERDMNDLDYSAGAVFLTKSPELANTYAGIGGAVYPVYLRKGQTLEIDGKGNDFTNVDGEAQSTDDIAFDNKDNPNVDSIDIKNIDDVGGEVLNQFKENADPDDLYQAGSFSESKEKTKILRDRAKGKDVSIIFDPKNIRSTNAAFDPDHKESSNLLAQSTKPRKQGEVDKSAPKLSALHNLSASNLKFADEIGGLAVPSIAVATDKTSVDGMGEITLIGTSDLVNPENVDVYDADAYTTTFPSPEYKKPSDKSVVELTDSLRPWIKQIEQKDYHGVIDRVYDSLTKKSPDPEAAIRGLRDSNIGKVMFIYETTGTKVRPVIKDVTLGNPEVADKELYDFFKAIPEDVWGKGANSDEQVKLRKDILVPLEIVTRRKYGRIKLNGLREKILKDLDNGDFFKLSSDGGVFFGDFESMRNDFNRIGQKEVDTNATEKKLDKKIKSKRNEYNDWATKKVMDLLEEPFIKVKGQNVSYTIDNIVQHMTQNSTQANEDTLAYGSGKARAAAATLMQDMESMREYAKENIKNPEDLKESREIAEELLSDFRGRVVDYYKGKDWRGEIDNFAGFDDAMRSIAMFAKNRSSMSDERAMKEALKRSKFKVVPSFIIDEGIAAGKAMLEAPVPYFEAKPERVVDLSEFVGAVVPSNVSQDILDILDKNNIQYTKYNKKLEGNQQRKKLISFRKKLAKDQDVLFQQERGSIELLPDDKRIIRLSKASDLSTFLHESGHLFLEMEKQYAKVVGVSEDQQAILDFVGVKSFDELDPNTDKGRAAHEKFAEGFENYLQEGKAPSPGLYEAFRSFKRWLLQVYKNLTAYPEVQLNQEIRDVFDRMLATDEEIKAVQAVYEIESDVESTSRAQETLYEKMFNQIKRTTTKEWKEEEASLYENELAELEETQVYKAEQHLRENKIDAQQAGEALGYLEPKVSKELDPKKDSIVVAIGKLGGLNRSEAELQGIDPVNWQGKLNVNKSYGIGKTPFRKDAGDSFDGMAENLNQYGYQDENGMPLTPNSLLELLSDELDGFNHYSNQYEPVIDDGIELSSKPRRLYGTTAKDGLDINYVAQEMGYVNGDVMLSDIASSKEIRIQASENAKASMLQKHGDILNDGTLEELARDAVQNEEKGKALLKELKALSGKDRQAPVINKAMLKKAAKEAIGIMPVKKLRGSVEAYHRKEVKAAQEYTTLQAEGDAEGAIQAKMEQLLNFYLFREGRDTLKKTESWRKYSQGVKTRKFSPHQVAPEFIANMKMFSSVFDFKKNPTNKTIENLKNISSWIKAQNIEGETPVVNYYHPLLQQIADPDFNAEDLVIKNWDNMTVNELRGIKEQLEHLRYIGGRMSSDNKFIQKEKAERLAQALESHAKGKDRKQYIHGGKRSFKDNLPTSWGLLSTITHIREFDGWRKDEGNGAWHQEIYQKLSDIDQASMSLESELDAQITDLIRPYYENLQNGKGTDKTFQDAIGADFTLSNSQRIMFAVYWGSPETRNTLLQTGTQGSHIDESSAQSVLDSLKDSDVEIVKGIWKINESLKARMFAKEKEINGVAPRAVDKMPFTVRGKTLEGGYQKITYVSSAKDGLKRGDPMQNALNAVGGAGVQRTSAGSMNERIGAGGRIIKLDFHNFISSIKESTQFIAGATESREIDAMLKSPAVKEVMFRKYGEDRYRSFVDGINGAILGDALELQGYNKWVDIFATARSKMSMAMLMYSLRNIAQQPVAITNLLATVNKADYIKTSAEIMGDIPYYLDMVNGKSQFMQYRMKFINREISDLVGSLDQSVAGGKMAAIKRHGYTIQTAIDKSMALPAWVLSYREGVRLYGDEKRAVQHADQKVKDALGSGRKIDLPPVLSGASEGGNPKAIETMKQITFMGSFFAKVGESYYRSVKSNDLRTAKGIANVGHDLTFTLLIPAIVSAVVVANIPEDEPTEEWALKEIGKYGLASAMGLRDLAGFMIDGFDPRVPFSSVVKSVGKTAKSLYGVAVEGDEVDGKLISRLVRDTAPFHGLPGSYQVARTIDGFADEEQSIAGALLEGKNRNE